MAYCNSCGEEILPNIKFCNNCGVSVKETQNKRSNSNIYTEKLTSIKKTGMKVYDIFYLVAILSLLYMFGRFGAIDGSAIRATVAHLMVINTSLLFVGARIMQILETRRETKE